MKNLVYIFLIQFVMTGSLYSQLYSISGQLLADDQEPILYANVVLYADVDSSIVKAGTSDIDGSFTLPGINPGEYILQVSYLGYDDLNIKIPLEDSDLFLTLTMNTSSVQLEEAVVTAKRALVEIKPDRTVFNVEGTINGAGDNGLGLLRKAPGVLVDNNNNIMVLSRSGVLIYIDGKRLPLTGDDLTNYLENLPAEQIDRIDIITNPGAKYEAEGNAGIIDIRLKKDKNLGSNGSVNGTISQGKLATGNVVLSGNYRNRRFNTFGTLGYNEGRRFNEMAFDNFQNGLFLAETNYMENGFSGVNFRWGTDFFIGKNHTLGFLVSGQNQKGDGDSENRINIAQASQQSVFDSLLFAKNISDSDRDQNTFNINYVYDNGKTMLNVDADYGIFRRDNFVNQPNQYFAPDGITPFSRIDTEYDTPVDIDIATFKIDVERPWGDGKLAFGSKLSFVSTDNTFLFYDLIDNTALRNDRRSNQFFYDEKVYAGYVNYARQINPKWNFSAGIRVETTDATGDLRAFLEELQESPIEFNYTKLFPSLGLTHSITPEHVLALNYGRRINRPDYNVLNPFREQLSELSYQRGNAFLSPEIVNNIELGYTLKYRYNFKLSYSKTDDQITRLIAPDENDPRAGFITWDNLASQELFSANITLPFQFNKWWNAFVNFGGGYLDNQADYGEGGIVDVQAWTYNIYQQHTFTLPRGFTGEVSGWFAGPGVWGGVFEYDESWSLNLGLQKKFFNKQMNVRISAQDIFYQTGWSGTSSFNGLEGTGNGNWDSRRGSISISYAFGNNQVKQSRNRKTGIEAEGNRVN